MLSIVDWEISFSIPKSFSDGILAESMEDKVTKQLSSRLIVYGVRLSWISPEE